MLGCLPLAKTKAVAASNRPTGFVLTLEDGRKLVDGSADVSV